MLKACSAPRRGPRETQRDPGEAKGDPGKTQRDHREGSPTIHRGSPAKGRQKHALPDLGAPVCASRACSINSSWMQNISV